MSTLSSLRGVVPRRVAITVYILFGNKCNFIVPTLATNHDYFFFQSVTIKAGKSSCSKDPACYECWLMCEDLTFTPAARGPLCGVTNTQVPCVSEWPGWMDVKLNRHQTMLDVCVLFVERTTCGQFFIIWWDHSVAGGGWVWKGQ